MTFFSLFLLRSFFLGKENRCFPNKYKGGTREPKTITLAPDTIAAMSNSNGYCRSATRKLSYGRSSALLDQNVLRGRPMRSTGSSMHRFWNSPPASTPNAFTRWSRPTRSRGNGPFLPLAVLSRLSRPHLFVWRRSSVVDFDRQRPLVVSSIAWLVLNWHRKNTAHEQLGPRSFIALGIARAKADCGNIRCPFPARYSCTCPACSFSLLFRTAFVRQRAHRRR
jgi:hypothetical protein